MAARPSAMARCVLPTPGGPRSRSASPCATPAAGRELADLARVERGLGGEVEVVEVAGARKVGDLARHLDAPLVLARDLPLDQEGERLAQGHFAARRLVNQIVELVADRGELEPGQPA